MILWSLDCRSGLCCLPLVTSEIARAERKSRIVLMNRMDYITCHIGESFPLMLTACLIIKTYLTLMTSSIKQEEIKICYQEDCKNTNEFCRIKLSNHALSFNRVAWEPLPLSITVSEDPVPIHLALHHCNWCLDPLIFRESHTTASLQWCKSPPTTAARRHLKSQSTFMQLEAAPSPLILGGVGATCSCAASLSDFTLATSSAKLLQGAVSLRAVVAAEGWHQPLLGDAQNHFPLLTPP